MTKSVFSVNVDCAKSKRQVMKAASKVQGVDSLAIDSNKKQLTVVGDVDPVKMVCKLRKKFNAKIETVEQSKKEGDAKPAKEEKGKPTTKEPEIQQIISHPYNYHCCCGNFSYGRPCYCCYPVDDCSSSLCTIL